MSINVNETDQKKKSAVGDYFDIGDDIFSNEKKENLHPSNFNKSVHSNNHLDIQNKNHQKISNINNKKNTTNSNKDDDENGYMPLNCINTFTQEWVIKCKITKKYELKPF